MKRIVCEMCGGTDLIKEDGVFVCQNCGTKYSLEEAKKLMIDVSGSTVKVENQAQYDNLVKLANTALDSENFVEAEKQANLALAIKATDYELFLLKARAIDRQTNQSKSRMLEVFNCYLSAYEILDDNLKKDKKNDLFDEIVDSFESEVSFWVNQLEAQRPTKPGVATAKETLEEAKKALKLAGEKLEIDVSEALINLDNEFISSVSALANNAWESTVAYNYYRDSLYDYGRHWKLKKDITDDYRPDTDIMNTFNDEVWCLLDIMEFATFRKNKKSKYSVLEAIYSNMAFFLEKLRDSISFKRYSYSDSYGSYYEYWTLDRYWTDETKAKWNSFIAEWHDAEKKIHQEAEEEKVRLAEEQKRKAEAEAKERFDKFWGDENGKKYKKTLETELASLTQQIDDLEKDILNIDGKTDVEKLSSEINKLQLNKKALGLFKGKEKKAIQEEIDGKMAKLNEIKLEVNKAEKEIRNKIDPLEKRVHEITFELTKPR